MPTIYREGPYGFFFYSREGQEPPHIHVERDELECKIWLTPELLVASSDFPAHELTKILKIVRQNQLIFVETYERYHKSKSSR